jgi:hypothetical protein
MAIDFVYSLIVYSLVVQHSLIGKREMISAILDIAFATALAFFTEGTTSSAYVLFVFAIVATGCRTGFQETVIMTACCVGAYLLTIVMSGIPTALMSCA